MSRFTTRHETESQRRRNELWQPQIEGSFIINGCLPADDDDRSLAGEMLSNSVSISYSTLHTAGKMPIVRWDAEFENWLQKQGAVLDALREERTRCVLPWEVLKHLPPTRKKGNFLYFSQGGLPSCMGHAHAFAHHSSALAWIGLGASLIYDPLNPIVAWAVSKGGSIRGGQSTGPMAHAGNLHGNYPISRVGPDNLRLPTNYRRFESTAEKNQSGIVFVPGNGETLARNLVRCCRAGLGVAVGNSLAVRSASIDSHGVKIAELGGGWAHATSFAGFRRIGKEEYVFWINSHGPIYGVSEEGEPADGAWMRVEKELFQFCASMTTYGAPYAIIPEAATVDPTNYGDFEIPFPKTWKF